MTITDRWLDKLRDFMFGDAVAAPSHMQVGSGGSASENYAIRNTLVTNRFIKAFTNKIKSANTGVSEYHMRVTVSDITGNGLAGQVWNEVGARNNSLSTGGDMVFGQFYTGITVAANTEYQFELQTTNAR